jgi:hypothetical protein
MENKTVTTMKDFIALAVRTEANDFSAISKRLSDARTIRLLHGAFGITEHAELLDMMKKHLFYGKAIDTVNLKEECGDILWYLAIIFDEMGWTFDEVGSAVIGKLRLRYPDKFNQDQALNRNLPAERTFLETVGETVGEIVDKAIVHAAEYDMALGTWAPHHLGCRECDQIALLKAAADEALPHYKLVAASGADGLPQEQTFWRKLVEDCLIADRN